MFAINHAATALVLKKAYPKVSLVWLLVSVQAMEFLWVALNFAGVEHTATESTIRSVGDIHLSDMPFSHSLATSALVALLAWLVLRAFGRKQLGLAVGLGVISHILLDLLTHSPDIAVAPGVSAPMLGLGLYSAAPLVAFVVELAYGIFCWTVFGGSYALLAAIVLFNLANLSLFSEAIPGPEVWLGGQPLLLVGVILGQIVVTLLVVGVLARRRTQASEPALPANAMTSAAR